MLRKSIHNALGKKHHRWKRGWIGKDPENIFDLQLPLPPTLLFPHICDTRGTGLEWGRIKLGFLLYVQEEGSVMVEVGLSV